MKKEDIQRELDQISQASYAKMTDKKLQRIEDLSNYQREVLKGSQPPALRPYNSYKVRRTKLTVQMVTEIRNKYIPYVYGKKKLSQEYGVSPSVILRIIRHKSWRNI